MKKLFFMTILTVFVFFNSLVMANAETVKFAVLSDIHISTTKVSGIGSNRDLTQSIHYLQQAVKQINDSDVDFVIFSGDAIDQTDKVSIVMFAKIINKLNKPYYVIPGNHDVAQVLEIDKKEFFHLINMYSGNRTRKVPCVKKTGDLVFIFMDGVNEFIPGAKGYFKEDELLWLDKRLKEYKNKKVVIVQHYPLVEPYVSKSHQTYNADEYTKLLAEHKNVIALISGHYHSDGEADVDGIKHISVPALVHHGEYEQIEIEKNPYNNKYIIKVKILDVQ